MSQYHEYREVAMAAKGRKDFSLSLFLSGPSPPPPPAHCAAGWSVTAPLLPLGTLWLLQAQEQGQRCVNLTNFAISCSLLTPIMHVLLVD